MISPHIYALCMLVGLAFTVLFNNHISFQQAVDYLLYEATWEPICRWLDSFSSREREFTLSDSRRIAFRLPITATVLIVHGSAGIWAWKEAEFDGISEAFLTMAVINGLLAILLATRRNLASELLGSPQPQLLWCHILFSCLATVDLAVVLFTIAMSRVQTLASWTALVSGVIPIILYPLRGNVLATRQGLWCWLHLAFAFAFLAACSVAMQHYWQQAIAYLVLATMLLGFECVLQVLNDNCVTTSMIRHLDEQVCILQGCTDIFRPGSYFFYRNNAYPAILTALCDDNKQEFELLVAKGHIQSSIHAETSTSSLRGPFAAEKGPLHFMQKAWCRYKHVSPCSLCLEQRLPGRLSPHDMIIFIATDSTASRILSTWQYIRSQAQSWLILVSETDGLNLSDILEDEIRHILAGHEKHNEQKQIIKPGLTEQMKMRCAQEDDCPSFEQAIKQAVDHLPTKNRRVLIVGEYIQPIQEYLGLFSTVSGLEIMHKIVRKQHGSRFSVTTM